MAHVALSDLGKFSKIMFNCEKYRVGPNITLFWVWTILRHTFGLCICKEPRVGSWLSLNVHCAIIYVGPYYVCIMIIVTSKVMLFKCALFHFRYDYNVPGMYIFFSFIYIPLPCTNEPAFVFMCHTISCLLSFCMLSCPP